MSIYVLAKIRAKASMLVDTLTCSRYTTLYKKIVPVTNRIRYTLVNMRGYVCFNYEQKFMFISKHIGACVHCAASCTIL